MFSSAILSVIYFLKKIFKILLFLLLSISVDVKLFCSIVVLQYVGNFPSKACLLLFFLVPHWCVDNVYNSASFWMLTRCFAMRRKMLLVARWFGFIAVILFTINSLILTQNLFWYSRNLVHWTFNLIRLSQILLAIFLVHVNLCELIFQTRVFRK